MLVGPTAAGKSLCAYEAFDRAVAGKPVYLLGRQWGPEAVRAAGRCHDKNLAQVVTGADSRDHAG